MERPYPWCDRLPVSVDFISTYICNIVCEHCDIWRFRGEELSTDDVKAMVSELRKLGTAFIKFEGGEPLTRPDIGELIRFSASQGMKTALCTNGLLVEENMSKLACLGRLIVSLSWTDGLTERVSVYERALKSIESAKKAGLDVEAAIVLTRANISALPAIIADCSAIGVRMRFRKLQRHENSIDNSRIGSMCPDNGGLEDALRYLSECKRTGAEVSFPLASKDFMGADDCHSEEHAFVISPSGDVAPCAGLLGLKKWPNGRSLGFQAAFRKAGEFYCPSEVFTMRGACNL